MGPHGPVDKREEVQHGGCAQAIDSPQRTNNSRGRFGVGEAKAIGQEVAVMKLPCFPNVSKNQGRASDTARLQIDSVGRPSVTKLRLLAAI